MSAGQYRQARGPAGEGSVSAATVAPDGPRPPPYDDRMRIVTLPRQQITAFASSGVAMDFLPRITDAERAHVQIAHLAAGGTLGEHPAGMRQVFAVLSGHGEVSADGGSRRPISAGQAAFWEPGEVHQTWASSDMVVVIVETAGRLDPDELFIEVRATREGPATD